MRIGSVASTPSASSRSRAGTCASSSAPRRAAASPARPARTETRVSPSSPSSPTARGESARRGRVDERDEAAVRAVEGLLVHEPDTRRLQSRERGAHVRHLEAEVVDAGPALVERLRDRPVRRRRLEELEVRLPHRAERRHDFLRRDLLAVLLQEPEKVPERAALLEATERRCRGGRSGRRGGWNDGEFGTGKFGTGDFLEGE